MSFGRQPFGKVPLGADITVAAISTFIAAVNKAILQAVNRAGTY